MIFLKFFTLISLFSAFGLAHVATPRSHEFYVNHDSLQPMSDNFERFFDSLMSFNGDIFHKRDSFSDTLESLLKTLEKSGVVLDVLHEIADSTAEMNTLANYIYQALVSAATNTSIQGLNITINITEIIQQVNDSGIISDTIDQLFFNEEQRNIFTDNLGETLLNNTWIPMLIYKVGSSGKISWETIFDTARNTKCQDSSFNGVSITYKYQVVMKRDDSSSGNYSGSLSSFINNVVQSALGSELLSESLDSILEAVKNSGIVVPIVQSVLADQKIQQMVGYIANKLYNYGVFDQIPLNDYFQNAKKSGVLSTATQKLFGNNRSSYVVGNVFLRLEEKGVNEQIYKCLWGT